MTDENIDWYLNQIKTELIKARDSKLIGSVGFQVNFFEGDVRNMNCSLGKSFKRTVFEK